MPCNSGLFFLSIDLSVTQVCLKTLKFILTKDKLVKYF